MLKFEEEHWEDLLADLQTNGDNLTQQERSVINLIASDNAIPSFFSNNPPYKGYMIQEGLVNRRPFAGAIFHDSIEEIAARAACKVFHADHANLQPHSCSQANQAVYHALLKPGDKILALGFKDGGHLTHGLKLNFSGRSYQFEFYGTGADGLIDYAEALDLALKISPQLIICGSSAYPRLFDAQKLRDIADSVGAKLMFDLSHEAGLIAAGVIPNPIPLADVATMSLDKTLRGPFGGAILCKDSYKDLIDKAVHPGTQSSFSVRKIADAAHALILTQESQFKAYAERTLANAKALEYAFKSYPGLLLTGGTDKHYVILDVQAIFNVTGEIAEQRLENMGILSSRQTLPRDRSAKMSMGSGLRLGTAWASSRGYGVSDFNEIADIILKALMQNEEPKQLAARTMALSQQKRKYDVWL